MTKGEGFERRKEEKEEEEERDKGTNQNENKAGGGGGGGREEINKKETGDRRGERGEGIEEEQRRTVA